MSPDRIEVRMAFVHMTNEGSETYEAAFVQVDEHGGEKWGRELIVHPDRTMEVTEL